MGDSSLDASETSVTNTAAEGATDTSAGASSQDTSSNETQTLGASAQTDSASADTQQGGDDNGSLTSGSVENRQNQDYVPATKFKEVHNAFTQTRQQYLEQQRQLQQMQEQLKQFQQRADANGPIWSKQHPKHADFRKQFDAYAMVKNNLARQVTDPARLQQALELTFGKDALNNINAYEQDLEQRKLEVLSDPEAYFQKMFEERFNQAMPKWQQDVGQRYQTAQQGRQQAEQWMEQNKEIATPENVQKILHSMEQGASFKEATMEIELNHWKSKINEATTAEASAEEKQRLLESNAANVITRKPHSSKKFSKEDIRSLFEKEGLNKPGMDSARMKRLMELDERGLLA